MTTQQLYCILLLAFPLLGFIINGLFGSYFKKASGYVSSFFVLLSFIISIIFFINDNGTPLHIHITHWFHITNWDIDLSFTIDHLSILMLLVINGVGTLIHIYSIGYMSHDEQVHRFFAYLNLFIFFMIFLVTGDNLLLMFIGWEGVGLCSYLLIGFWSENMDYNLAAKKAFVMNRIGDIGFILAIFYILEIISSLNFIDINSAITSGVFSSHEISIITLLLFLAATGKSAQIPLFTWLPDAMAGPTPVSALIHAATMVTAGIYLIIRTSALFLAAPFTMEVILWIGVTTCMLGAIIGIKQNDIKKVLAYSTVSQLGLLFVALGSGAFVSSYFHLFTHAFFKALLFLGAGSVIHAMSGEQDMRKMGGLRKKIPITYFTFLIGTLAIAGFPPFSGFFSKDEILEHVFEHNIIAYALIQLSSFITVFYMFRLFFVTFHGEFRGTEEQKNHLHESPIYMTLPLIILALFSIGSGIVGLPHYTGMHHWLNDFLGSQFNFVKQSSLPHSTLFMLIGIAVGGALITFVIAYVVYINKKVVPKSDEQLNFASKFVSKKFYIDELYDYVIKYPINFISSFLYKIIDQKIIDKLVEFTGLSSINSGEAIRKIQTGNIGLYLFIMTIASICLIILQFLVR